MVARDMVLTMVSNAMDGAMLVVDKATNQWHVAELDDTMRASVPMNAADGYKEHTVIGLAISFNSTFPVQLSKYTSTCCIPVNVSFSCDKR